MAQCHDAGVCHGDIRAENVALTSWDWAFIVDFAPYKPTLLPADNPADFSFFFDTGSRRKCCIAPERLYDPAPGGPGPVQAAVAPLTPAMVGARCGEAAVGGPAAPSAGACALPGPSVSLLPGQACAGRRPPPVVSSQALCLATWQDVFSLGCVLAELFLDGQPLFDYSRLLAYRVGGAAGAAGPAPLAALDKVHPSVRGMIAHMVQRDPSARHSVQQYLQVRGCGGLGGCGGRDRRR